MKTPVGFTNNTARILRTVWCTPGISRIEIAGVLGVDKSTVTNQVNVLLEQGIICEDAVGESGANGGRKPISLTVAKDYGYVIGVEVQIGSIRTIALNLAAEVIDYREEIRQIDRRNLSDAIEDACAVMRDRVGGRSGRFLGVGVGLAGLIDRSAGRIVYSVPLLITSPLVLTSQITERWGGIGFIENDAKCCAWGELVFHRGESLGDFIFTLAEFRDEQGPCRDSGGVGIGLGIVLDGKVRYGTRFGAGEFKSVFADAECGAQVSISPADLARIRKDKAVLARFSRELAKNIAMMANSFDIGRIFVGGDIETSGYDFCALLAEEVARNWMYPEVPHRAEVSFSSLGVRAVSYGAAAMILDHLISNFKA